MLLDFALALFEFFQNFLNIAFVVIKQTELVLVAFHFGIDLRPFLLNKLLVVVFELFAFLLDVLDDTVHFVVDLLKISYFFLAQEVGAVLRFINHLLGLLIGELDGLEDLLSSLLDDESRLFSSYELVPRVVKDALGADQQLARVSKVPQSFFCVVRTHLVFLQHFLVLSRDFQSDKVFR
eukprot:CAMPEP_0168330876 /NCGR_PEP_ID=MMETSP0213-20121227/8002_1 /TAXON_ID=151035 /ORGANISM="Euplotes harpa, Strain FSP1.4" /LENGTH=179 /DNA_ID=CAMNT_0008334551 /DNA_START=1183 /DNA_END=1722 /DNA_ORIENTATION=+